MVSRARVRRIRDRLRELYGRPVAPPHGHGLDELILTVLSQSTNDRNRDAAFLRLRDRFPHAAHPVGTGAVADVDWEAVRDAPNEDVEAAIRPGGISKIKSVRIQEILRQLPDPMDGPHLRDQDFLTSLPGVGRKPAACVRLFAYGERDVPVDTHVSRVGTRLGLFREGAPFHEMHDDMLAITPRGQELEFHVNLLRHGRRTCFAQRPDCPTCALRRMCPGRVR